MRLLNFLPLSIFVILVFSILAFAAEEKGPKLVFAETEYDFGEVDQGETYDHIFEFTNQGDETLVIERVVPSCGCTTMLLDANEIPPSGKGKIKVALTHNVSQVPW